MTASPAVPESVVQKLRKIWGMDGSGFAGERRNAREAAARLLARHGLGLADVERLLGVPAGSPPRPAPSGLSASELAEQRRRAAAAPARAALLARYGSFEAVSAWTPPELALRDAVARWSLYDGRWTRSIDGRDYISGKVSDRVLRALSEAFPLPSTVTQAEVEHRFWQDRDRDLQLAADCYYDTELDLPAYLRRNIVGDLLGHGLRSGSLAELLLRYRYLEASDFHLSDEERSALGRDIEHLAGLAAPAVQCGRCSETVRHGRSPDPVQGEHPRSPASDDAKLATATARRRAIEALLSTLDGRALSDREIARRVGASPQTVGNIRRRLARLVGG